MKDIYQGEINEQGVELAPDWTALGIHPVTGFLCVNVVRVDAEKNINEKRKAHRKYMKQYYQKKKSHGL